ncbi:MAG TPA: tRNA lysidine(34) synthetase TilS [Gammaproteobacteria bacterium]|nr:tRNA lysidine(34) synthetase TilS [Gammaproteobacteria bacterium]
MNFDPHRLVEKLRTLSAAPHYWVAFSGGLDSSVLLHALAVEREALPGELRAVHVNHGLLPEAQAWQQHCEAVCHGLRVPLICRSITVRAPRGESLEACARERRYAAFAGVMQAGDSLLLAQHQDDQMETFLLQSLRGTGLAGLSAMPAEAAFAAGRVLRPLLDVPRPALQQWAVQQGLSWIEDPSNLDTRFDRNYLRHRVLPVLRSRWPAAAVTLARTARHCGEALELLDAQAAEDLHRYTDQDGDTLSLHALRSLPRGRAKYLVRHWLVRAGFSVPPAHKLARLFDEVIHARADRLPCVAWPGVEVRRYRERLYVRAPAPAMPAAFRLRAGEYRELGAGLGRLGLVPSPQGIPLAACPAAGLDVGFRHGGEVCRPAGRPHHRPLKKWLQEAGVLPWMRASLPMLGRDGEVMAVAGLFVCEPWRVQPGEPGLGLVWENAPRVLAVTEKDADYPGSSVPPAF